MTTADTDGGLLASPPRSHHRDLPISSTSSFDDDVGLVRSALQDLEQGHFFRPAQLAEAMVSDDRIEGVLQTRVDALFGLPLEITPQGDGRRSAAVAKDVEEGWERRFPQEELKKLLRWALHLRIVPFELIWELRANRWDFRIKIWDPRFLWWNWSTRSYWLTTQDGNVEVLAGNGQWGLFAPFGQVRGAVYGLLRSLAMLFLVRRWAMRDWARYSEVHGLPIKKGTVPAEATPEEKQEFDLQLRRLGRDAVLRLPQSRDGSSWGLELIEAKAQSHEAFQRLLERCDENIAILMLGQNLTTKAGSGGSFALGAIHDRIRQDRLEADAKSLAPCLYQQCLRPWALYNYGSADLAPQPGWSTKAPEDRGATATTLNALGDALNKLRQAGLNIDLKQVATQFRIPLVEGKPLVEPTAPAPAQPAKTEEQPTR